MDGVVARRGKGTVVYGAFRRILCGKRNEAGRYRCPGLLCLWQNNPPSLWFGPVSSEGVHFEGRELRGGVWREPLPKTRNVTALERFRDPAQRKEWRRAGPLLGSMNIVEVTLEMTIPVAECPRCHLEQPLLDPEEFKLLRDAATLNADD